MASEGMKCPSCGKDGLVRCQHEDDDVFQCVYCDYRHDLTTSLHQEGIGFFEAFIALLLMLLIVLPLASVL